MDTLYEDREVCGGRMRCCPLGQRAGVRMVRINFVLRRLYNGVPGSTIASFEERKMQNLPVLVPLHQDDP